ncbi:MAG: cyclopropane-fatty-acyl-phospholipid synthase family protein [Pseudomonadota bacterium]
MLDGCEVITEVAGQRNLPRWFAPVFTYMKGFERGAVEFVLPDGRVFRAEGSAPGPEGRVIVEDVSAFGRMIRDGEIGFAETYMEGMWRTPDLQTLLDAILLNNENVAHKFEARPLMHALNRFRHWLNRNTRRQARRNIERHYDLGNTFYERWLDPTMTYSSALFDREDQPLDEAQRAKYRSICDRMELRQGDHVLEIGCGWGGFAEYAARERGARVTGLTISPAQLDFAQARMQRAGLSERVEIVLRDYRDERGAYDGVASIEMFEAVGEKYWPVFFDAVRDRLKPGKCASIQVITIADHLFDRYRTGVDFIQKYIFPGGMLPSPSALRREADRAGLDYVDSLEFGESYSETLRRWRTRFNDAWGEIQTVGGPQFDARFHRMWNFYLAVCAACFRAGSVDVAQVRLRRV